MTEKLLKSKFLWIGIGIFLLNVFLKFWHISTPEIGIDEPFTIYYANADIRQLWEILPYENNPPLFTLILKVWVHFLGVGPTSVRFLPMIFSSLAAVALFRLGRTFFNTNVAWIATGIFTFSSAQFFYAHEARPYALFVMLAILVMYAFLKVVNHKSNPHKYWLILFAALLIYNHFFGFLVLFVQFLALLLNRYTKKEDWKRMLFVWIGILILFSPYLPLLFGRFSSSAGGTWVPAPHLEGLYVELWRFSNEPVNTVLFIAMLFLGTLFYFIRKDKPKINLQTTLVILWFLFCFLFMFLVSFKLPIFLDRYLIYISPAFYLLIGIALVSLFKNQFISKILGVAFVLLMLITVNFKAGNPKKQAYLVDNFIQKGKESETIVIVSPDWYSLQIAYYYNIEYFLDAENTRDHLRKDGFRTVDALTDELKLEILEKKYVVFVDAGANYVDSDGMIKNYLESQMTATSVVKDIEGLTVTYYKRN